MLACQWMYKVSWKEYEEDEVKEETNCRLTQFRFGLNCSFFFHLPDFAYYCSGWLETAFAPCNNSGIALVINTHTQTQTNTNKRRHTDTQTHRRVSS